MKKTTSSLPEVVIPKDNSLGVNPTRNLRDILVMARGLVEKDQFSVRDAVYASAVNGESDSAAMKALQDAGLVTPIMTIDDALQVFDRAIDSASLVLANPDPGKSLAPETESSKSSEWNKAIEAAAKLVFNDGHDTLAAMIRALASTPESDKCKWQIQHNGSWQWVTMCGISTQVFNSCARYCCFCGRPVPSTKVDQADENKNSV